MKFPVLFEDEVLDRGVEYMRELLEMLLHMRVHEIMFGIRVFKGIILWLFVVHSPVVSEG